MGLIEFDTNKRERESSRMKSMATASDKAERKRRKGKETQRFIYCYSRRE